jgi:hypothetical protein
MVSIYVEDIASVLASYDKVRLYRATSQTGAASLVTTITLVTDTRLYTYTDTAAAPTDWYEVEYYNSSTAAVSARSTRWPASQPVTTSLLKLRQTVADEMGAYASGTTTGAGAANGTTVVDSTSVDLALTGEEYIGGWLQITSGANSGQLRRVSGYDQTTGTFTVSRGFTAQVASGVTWSWYNYLQPSEYDDCINDCLSRLLYEDVWDFVAAGDDQVRYTLPYYLQNLLEVLDLAVRDDHEGDDATWTLLQPGDYWVEYIGGVHSIVFAAAPGVGNVYRARLLRPYSRLTSDTDTTQADPLVVEAGAQVQAYLRLIKKARPNQDVSVWKERLALVWPTWDRAMKQQRPRTLSVKRFRADVEVE